MIQMQNAIILTEDEYFVLRDTARMARKNLLTEEERDAIVYALRCLKWTDVNDRMDSRRFARVLTTICKKLEGYSDV